MKLIEWIKSWRRTKKLVSAVDAKITRVLASASKADQTLNKHLERIDTLHNELNEEILKARASIREAEQINTKSMEALDALRDELETCRDIVIPGLTAANETFRVAWDAQTAQNALMQVAAQQQKEQE